LGKYLAAQGGQPGILRSAYLKGVPVFIPAFTDSEFRVGFGGLYGAAALAEGKNIGEALGSVSLKFNPFLDLPLTRRKRWPPEAGNLYGGWGRPPELGPTGGPLSGTAA